MNMINYNIRIESEQFGKLLNENFYDKTQFKLFLKMIHGCLELKNDLSFFNGDDFLVHIPFKYLVNSVVLSNVDSFGFTDQVKSKIEALATK